MADLRRDTLLQRAPDLVIRLESGGRASVQMDGTCVELGPDALLLLDAFAQPRTLDAALDRLPATASSQRWIDLTTSAIRLYRLGLLRETGKTPAARPRDFDSPYVHVAMLNDRTRTGRYLDAIAEVVRPGDVVVDLGTGTGILAAAAARAGARHVYAIEAGNIARTARAFFEANGLADRITLIENWSTHVELPEQADVLISEIIGNDPLDERVLQATADACTRFLHDRSRLIPSELRLYGFPVSIPSPMRERFTYTPASANRWRVGYGFDFDALVDMGRHDGVTFPLPREQASKLVRLSEPIEMARICLRDNRDLCCRGAAEAVIAAPGLVDGVMLYFELRLSERITLSTDPRETDTTMHWQNVVWLFHDPLPVRERDRLDLAFEFDSTSRSISARLRSHGP